MGGERALWQAIVFVCTAGAFSTIALAIIAWRRQGRLSEAFAEVRTLIERSQPVALGRDIEQIRGEVASLSRRVDLIDEERRTRQLHFIEISNNLLRKMDAMQEEWHVIEKRLAVEIAADISHLVQEDVLRMARKEVFATLERAKKQETGENGA